MEPAVTKTDIEVPFLSHMLAFTNHSLCNLRVWARGDIQIDDHHTVEDIGICLGQAIKESLEIRGELRHGSALIPMDVASAQVVVDLSGRSYLDFNVNILQRQGELCYRIMEEFFELLSTMRK